MLATLAAFAGQAAVVYKWTDPNGLVHYSDQPVPGAEKIFTASSAAPNGAAAAARSANQGVPDTKKTAAPGLGYNQFSITSPAPDQTFFADDVVSVHLALEPGLKPDQIITWHLNGKEFDRVGPNATQFSLQALDRGAYVLAATITDQNTGESISTDSLSFFVRHPSALSPLHHKP